MRLIQFFEGDVVDLDQVKQQRRRADIRSHILRTLANMDNEMDQRGQEYSKAGKLPIPLGTRMLPSPRSGDTNPWTIVSYYIDPRNPDRYGYVLRNPEKDETYTQMVNDPKVGMKATPGATKHTRIHGFWKPMIARDVDEDEDSLKLDDVEVGDEVKVGRFKNSKAIVKGFKKDDHNQPVLKTTKGDQKLFKPRISKLEKT